MGYKQNIALTIIILFALIGCVITAVIAHEAVHYNDYHNDSYADRICVIDIKSDWSVGYFQEPFAEYLTYTDKKLDMGEFKAYAVSGIIGLLFIITEGIVIREWIKKTKEGLEE